MESPFDVARLPRRTVLADGAWATELWRHGLPCGTPPEAWNLSHPNAVADVARRYAAAGSAIVLTNTFGANRCRLEPQGHARRTTAINEAGVRLSREGVAGKSWVFASIGPSGRALLDRAVDDHELRTVFAEQAEALHGAGADALVIETMSDLAEAEIAVACAAATGLAVVGSLSFHAGAERDFDEIVDRLATAGAAILGANCGAGVEEHIEIVERYRAAWPGPLWIKANAGLPRQVGDRLVYDETPDAYADKAMRLVDAGASILGGCCGTTPEFIAAMHARLRGRPGSASDTRS